MMTNSTPSASADRASASRLEVPEWTEAVSETVIDNPRKRRKKSSRACDFCHVNHQPCDNAKPRCGYCEKHGKQCLYLRPQKKRGPAQGYRNALHSMRESAAAWGAALSLIPDLGSLVEEALARNDEAAQRIIRAVKDPEQQDGLIQSWQQSGAFRAFFGDDAAAAAAAAGSGPGVGDGESDSKKDIGSAPLTKMGASIIQPSPSAPSPPKEYQSPMMASFHQGSILTPPSHDGMRFGTPNLFSNPTMPPPSFSLSDLVAKDAARSSEGFSQTLGSLGFAPGETLEDFVAMTSNPEPITEGQLDSDPSLGSEMDQKAYYELLMGRSFFP